MSAVFVCVPFCAHRWRLDEGYSIREYAGDLSEPLILRVSHRRCHFAIRSLGTRKLNKGDLCALTNPELLSIMVLIKIKIH